MFQTMCVMKIYPSLFPLELVELYDMDVGPCDVLSGIAYALRRVE